MEQAINRQIDAVVTCHGTETLQSGSRSNAHSNQTFRVEPNLNLSVKRLTGMLMLEQNLANWDWRRWSSRSKTERDLLPRVESVYPMFPLTRLG